MRPKNFSRTDWLFAAAVLGLHVFVYASALLRKAWLTDDSIQYLTLAENLSQSGVFSQSFYEPLVPDLQRVPGYPVLLTVFRWPWLVLLVQHLMVLGTGFFLYKGLRPYFKPGISKWATWLWLIQPYPILFASLYLSETLYIFLLVAGFSFWMQSIPGGDRGKLLLGFALMALSAYVRPTSYLIVPALAVITGILLIKKSGKKGIPTAVSLVSLVILLLMPWMVRNANVSGKFTFNSMGPQGLWYGRMAGLQALKEGEPLHDQTLYRLGDSLAAEEFGLANIKAYPQGKAMQETEILTFPVARKTVWGFLGSPAWGFRQQVVSAWQMLKGVGLGWGTQVVGTPGSWVLAALQGLMNLVMFSMVIVALFRRKGWLPVEKWALVMVFFLIMLSLAIWSDGRYRVPADVFMMVFVAAGISRFFPKSESTTP